MGSANVVGTTRLVAKNQKTADELLIRFCVYSDAQLPAFLEDVMGSLEGVEKLDGVLDTGCQQVHVIQKRQVWLTSYPSLLVVMHLLELLGRQRCR